MVVDGGSSGRNIEVCCGTGRLLRIPLIVASSQIVLSAFALPPIIFMGSNAGAGQQFSPLRSTTGRDRYDL